MNDAKDRQTVQRRALRRLEDAGGLAGVLRSRPSALAMDPWWRERLRGLTHEEALSLTAALGGPMTLRFDASGCWISNGNHRLEALHELGVASVAITIELGDWATWTGTVRMLAPQKARTEVSS